MKKSALLLSLIYITANLFIANAYGDDDTKYEEIKLDCAAYGVHLDLHLKIAKCDKPNCKLAFSDKLNSFSNNVVVSDFEYRWADDKGNKFYLNRSSGELFTLLAGESSPGMPWMCSRLKQKF